MVAARAKNFFEVNKCVAFVLSQTFSEQGEDSPWSACHVCGVFERQMLIREAFGLLSPFGRDRVLRTMPLVT